MERQRTIDGKEYGVTQDLENVVNVFTVHGKYENVLTIYHSHSRKLPNGLTVEFHTVNKWHGFIRYIQCRITTEDFTPAYGQATMVYYNFWMIK